MELSEVRLVLHAASLEEVADGAVSDAVRKRAVQSAPDPGDPGGDGEPELTAAEEAFLIARSRAVVDGAGRGETWGRARFPVGLAVCGLPLAALLLGFLSKGLGPGGVVNILAFPLLAVMAWNVVVYLLIGAKALRGGGAHGGRAAAAFLRRHLCPPGKYGAGWWRAASPSAAGRAGSVLHLAAAALAAGAVAGMYWQGIVRDYQATWESTFLSAGAVRGLLSVALAPAAWVPGLALPDAAGFEALRSPGGERAADWIHRYAISAGAVVVLPRLALAGLAAARAGAAARRADLLELAPSYVRRVLDERRGKRRVVKVVPHRIDLDPARRDGLREALHAHWSGALWIDFVEPVAYGEEEAFGARSAGLGEADYVAVAAGFNSTPEEESQGRLLAALPAGGGDGATPLLWLDASGFRDRFGDGRFGERREAWARLADGAGWDLVIDEGGAAR